MAYEITLSKPTSFSEIMNYLVRALRIDDTIYYGENGRTRIVSLRREMACWGRHGPPIHSMQPIYSVSPNVVSSSESGEIVDRIEIREVQVFGRGLDKQLVDELKNGLAEMVA